MQLHAQPGKRLWTGGRSTESLSVCVRRVELFYFVRAQQIVIALARPAR